MADHCCICDTRRPIGGTNILVLNGGEFWLEFCPNCVSEPITNAETGETIAVGTLWARANGLHDPDITIREPYIRFDSYDAEMEDMYLEMLREEERVYLEELANAPTVYERFEDFVLRLGTHIFKYA